MWWKYAKNSLLDTYIAKLGETPIPAGYIRLYHYTKADPAIIREQGLKMSAAKGETYGEPNLIWASSLPPDPNSHNIVEFAVKADDPRFSHGLNEPKSYQNTNLDEWQKGSNHVGFVRDVLPSEIIQVHEPWHTMYENIKNDKETVQEILEGKHDKLISDNIPEYKETILKIKEDHGNTEPITKNVLSSYNRHKYAGYSTELGELRELLQTEFEPYDFIDKVGDFLGEDEFDIEESEGWINNATPEELDDFKNYALRTADDDSYYAPAYTSMNFNRNLNPQWMTHFTDNAEDIADDGFKYGHPELEGVHLTTYKRNRKKEPGYNFAFPLNRRVPYDVIKEGKYGKNAVIFYTGGIEAEHYGDQENQAITWGPTVDKRMIFPIYNDHGSWYVQDDNGRILIEDKNFDDVAGWVIQNWRMLASVKERNLRRKQMKRMK